MNIKKYAAIFRISLHQEFAYRLNFIMWRVRNVIQIFLIFYLWDSVFGDPKTVIFGYSRAKILTYVFGLLIIKSIVTGSRSGDVAGEIADGRLTNYLVKPVSYFKYWFTRDVSTKFLNLIFAVFEVTLLVFFLKPPVYIQTNLSYLLLFIISLGLAVLLYFLLLFIFDMVSLWYPENAWGSVFLLLIFVEFMGGGIFPIDVLPQSLQSVLYLTPFPYLLFIPIQTYLGKLEILLSIKSIIFSGVWVVVLGFILNYLWNRGLKVYRAEGR